MARPIPISKSPYRDANRMLALRDELREQLGEHRYHAFIAPYLPALRAEMDAGCRSVTVAATRVLERLQGRGSDIAVQRLVTCAAVDLALAS